MRSAAPSRRTVAFRNPIASAVSTMTGDRRPIEASSDNPTAHTIAAARSNASPLAVSTSHRRRELGSSSEPRRPPSSAPTRKLTSASKDALTERPLAPASANARNTTLPVMLAVNTWPSPR